MIATLIAILLDGSTLELYAEPGPCVGSALSSAWVSADATKRIPGCWTTDGRSVSSVFFDGELVRIPVSALRKPEAL